MGLFDLFRKSEWRKLHAYPPGVQQDIAYLVSLDSFIETAIASAIRQTFTVEKVGISDAAEALCKALAGKPLANELHLGVLTTGDGKEFAKIKWAYLPPARAVSVLGILAMCEFRNSGQPIVQNDLKYSGYSKDPDEARAQYLVLTAQSADVDDLDEVKAFESMVFIDFWSDLRKIIFQDIQLNVISESLGLSAAIKDRFERLSQPRQETLLLLADSLSKMKPNSGTAPSAAPKAAPPLSLEQNKKLHPLWFVPFPKLVKTMDKVSPNVLHFFEKLSIDDYELRRVTGAKDFVPSGLLYGLVEFDADILAYCIVIAAIMKAEPDFGRCGVWKKITETFEKRNMAQIHLAAQAQVNGMLGDAKINLEIDDPKKSSLRLNLMMEIRRAPLNYAKAPGNQLARLRLLLSGTLILRHVLNHPRYGSALSTFVIDTLASLEPVLEELKNGELLVWDQQKELQIP